MTLDPIVSAAPSTSSPSKGLITPLWLEIVRRYPDGYALLEGFVSQFRAQETAKPLEIPIKLGLSAAQEMHLLLTADSLRWLCEQRFKVSFSMHLPQTIVITKQREPFDVAMSRQIALLKRELHDQEWVKHLLPESSESHTALLSHVSRRYVVGWNELRTLLKKVYDAGREEPMRFIVFTGVEAESLLNLLRNTALRAFIAERERVRIQFLAPCNILVTPTRPLEGAVVDPDLSTRELLQRQLNLFAASA